MDDKNKKTLGIGLGALALLGLGIGLSKMRGGTTPPPPADGCGNGYHRDASGGCIPDDNPPPGDVDMSPAAIWERANLIHTDRPAIINGELTATFKRTPGLRPAVRGVGFVFRPNSTPGERIPVFNTAYWETEFTAHSDNITYWTDYTTNFCADNPTCVPYYDGSMNCTYEERGPGSRIGQLVKQYDQWNEGNVWIMFRWDGTHWAEVMTSSTVVERLPGAEGPELYRDIWKVLIGKADVTIVSDVDYIVPPDIMCVEASIADSRDSQMVPDIRCGSNSCWQVGKLPGPDFVYAVIPSLGDVTERSSWLHLEAGVPHTFRNLDVYAVIRSAFSYENEGSFLVSASAYQGGKIPAGTYMANIRIWFPKVCIMNYNVNWYEPPTTEENFYPDDIPANPALGQFGALTVFDSIASFSITQSEVLSDTLKFWHYGVLGCGCDYTVQNYLPQGNCTMETSGGSRYRTDELMVIYQIPITIS